MEIDLKDANEMMQGGMDVDQQQVKVSGAWEAGDQCIIRVFSLDGLPRRDPRQQLPRHDASS